MAATIKIPVPESFEAILKAGVSDGSHLERWSLEALVIEAFREGIISRGKIGELLDLPFHERESWLKKKGVSYQVDIADLKSDRETLHQLLDR